MAAIIDAVSYVLPAAQLDNDTLAARHPDWPIDKISEKTGIRLRHTSAPDEFSLELAIAAGRKLIDEHDVDPGTLDFVILCSQTPKFLIPTSACLVQHALGLPIESGALDVNQGCSGYVSCLMLAEGLLDSGRASGVLLITSDTYTKLVDPDDRSLKTIMGDAASASVIRRAGNRGTRAFSFGTDGSGYTHITAQRSALAGLTSGEAYRPDFSMQGTGVFNFVLSTIPSLIDGLLDKAGVARDDVDLFVFHQANAHMLESVRLKMEIPRSRFFVSMQDVGNTGATSIPIALYEALRQERIGPGRKVVLAGFGAGLSWSASLIDW
ncbi:ketoacyl-ACP synthase III [Burkholderia ambifaria]|uniref:3-oxoacyl-ACP synthase III family protein n=1 Tax=Burkholderia ambifaria TaxID=152480 RepID=UPI0013FD8F65|nr:ketoacyl-ACP synthase III [Burkholderia ambifaria]MBR8185171.1 ketoacyl-ACP synthase III [Burkholderia ambifaria]NHL70381.1 ketoacyl-ACP synthase III [Burkholderia ambifaria]